MNYNVCQMGKLNHLNCILCFKNHRLITSKFSNLIIFNHLSIYIIYFNYFIKLNRFNINNDRKRDGIKKEKNSRLCKNKN